MATTPNLKLELIAADLRNWSQMANQNYQLIDATVGAYFSLQNLQGVWENSRAYDLEQTVVDGDSVTVWQCQVAHTSAMAPTTFAEDRAAHPTYWTVYSSPARARGAWTGPGTNYAVNDFVVSGSKYAVCIVTHVSGLSFDSDEAAGNWSTLVDLSLAGSQVLPVPGGVADANKFVTTTAAGTGYTIINSSAVLTLLGATSLGTSLLQATSDSSVRSLINAQVAGSYQAQSTYLSAISGLTVSANSFAYFNASSAASLGAISTFGLSLVDDNDAATARTTLGLGTAAVLAAGTSPNNVVQLDGSSKLPIVDGSALTNLNASALATGTVDRARGGFTPTEIPNVLGANVAMNSTASFFTGPSTAQGTAGKWYASGHVTLENTVGGDRVIVRLWDGSTIIASTTTYLVSVGGSYYASVHLSGMISSPAGNIRISVKPIARTDGVIAFNSTGDSRDSVLSVFRIG